MKNAVFAIGLALLILVSFVAHGSTTGHPDTQIITLNYDGFFDRMDDLDEPEYVDVKLAFYLTQMNGVNQGQPCPIHSARLVTKIKQSNVYYLEDGEVLLPFDEQLDMDKAKLQIETSKDLQCGLNMRLENSKLLTADMPTADLLQLSKTFNLALKDLGGMMSYFVPDVSGVTIVGQPGDMITILNGSGALCENNQCQLTTQDLTQFSQRIRFSHVPVKILPYIKR